MGLSLSANPEHVNGYTLINLQKQLNQHPPPGMRGGQVHQARAELGFCTTLLCGRNYLSSYGVPCLSRYLREKLHDATDRRSTELRAAPEYVRLMQLMAAYVESGQKHPKLERLEAVIVQHFRSIVLPAPAPDSVSQLRGTPLSQSRASRVIVFCENRSAVEEIVDALQTHRPLVKAMPFVGQVLWGEIAFLVSFFSLFPLSFSLFFLSLTLCLCLFVLHACLFFSLSLSVSFSAQAGAKGLTQKQQSATIEKFKAGGYNTLVSTSIGEEGLDIGEVDLIVFFDLTSSTRTVQRMGRTGRARSGRCVILAADASEAKEFRATIAKSATMFKHLKGNAKGPRIQFCTNGVATIPAGIIPQVCSLFFSCLFKRLWFVGL